MANRDFTSAATDDGPKVVAPGITRNDRSWGYYLNGRKDDLLRAGLAKESWFADGVELDERGRVVRTKHVEWEGRSVTSRWYASSDHFYITVHYGQKELDAKDQSKRYDQLIELTRKLTPTAAADLLREIKARRPQEGLLADPGFEVAAKLLSASGSRFEVGDVAIVYWPESKLHGLKVEVDRGYHLSKLGAENGPFISNDGVRFEYRWGYGVRELGGEPSFLEAGRLRNPDYSTRHVRLVKGMTAEARHG